MKANKMNDEKLNKSEHTGFLPRSYVSFDLEATGNSKFNYMIEISAFKIKDFRIVDEYSTLIKPPEYRKVHKSTRILSYCEEDGHKIYYVDRFIEKLTGIDNPSIHRAQNEDEVIKKFRDFVGDSILVGHGVNNDINLLRETYQRVFGTDFVNLYIDTQVVGLFLDNKEYSLISLCDKYGIDNVDIHRARSDAYRTHLSYKKLYEDIEDKYSTIPEKIFYNWIQDRNSRQNRILKNRTMKSMNVKNWSDRLKDMQREDYLALDFIGSSIIFDESVKSDVFHSMKKRLKKFDIRIHREVFSNSNYMVVADIENFIRESKNKADYEKMPNLKRVLSFNMKGKKIKVIDLSLFVSKLEYLEKFTAESCFTSDSDEFIIRYPSKTTEELIDEFTIAGKSFYVYNDFSTMTSYDLKRRLTSDGAEVRESLEDGVDYLLVGEGRDKEIFYNTDDCKKFLEFLAYGYDIVLLNEENFKLCVNSKTYKK